MGIRSKIKKRLPIFGKKTPPQASKPPAASQPSYTPPVFEEPKSARGDTPVEEFIQNLVSENKVVLFMKGSPQQPLCGFSANAAGILSGYDKDFAHFDVISDPDVRQGRQAALRFSGEGEDVSGCSACGERRCHALRDPTARRHLSSLIARSRLLHAT